MLQILVGSRKATKREGWVFYQGLTVTKGGAPTPRVGPVEPVELEGAFKKAEKDGKLALQYCTEFNSSCIYSYRR